MQLFKSIFYRIVIISIFIIIIPLIFISTKIYLAVFSLDTSLTQVQVTNITGNLTIIVGLTYSIAIVFLLIGIYFVLKHKLLPFERLLKSSKKLASGDMSVKFKSNSNDELGELTRAINHMKDRLQYSVVKLRNSYEREKQYRSEAETANKLKTEFLDKASQELSVPLKPIINYSNLVISKINEGAYDENLNKKIRVIRECADNMLNIVSNLDEVIRLETGKIELNKSRFDTSVFIEELVNLHHYSASSKSLMIKTIYSDNFPKILYTDKEILFHILSNILAYMIHYSPDSAEVTITSESNENNILFMIEDNISGAQSELIGQIFQNSSDRIANMTLHLSNARLFGLISAISNAEFLNGHLEAETTNDNHTIFRLILDKSQTVANDNRKFRH